MAEWILGITDAHPSQWQKVEPLWQDEQVIVPASQSFHSLMKKLCDTAIKNRREHHDHGIDAHLWNMKILPLSEAIKHPNAVREERLMRAMGEDFDSDSSDEEEGNSECSRQRFVIRSSGHEEMGDCSDSETDEEEVVSSSRTLNEDMLSLESVIQVTYDYGTSTVVYLKVLSIHRTKNSPAKSLIHYFTLEEDEEKLLRSIQGVPAYKLPKEKWVDHFFPTAAKAFLGYYIPLFTSTRHSSKDDYEDSPPSSEQTRKVMGSMTLGLSSRITSDDDTTFCSMENRTCSADLLFCPPILDPNELLEAVESAWQSRDPKSDPDQLDMYRYDSIMRFLVSANDEEEFKRVSEMIQSNGFGPKRLLCRLGKDRKKSGFDFAAVFPKTNSMLTCGKFRWIVYRQGVLRVIAGRGIGSDHRKFQGRQVLKSWKHDFKSLHELFCAVEASWVWNGQELTADTIIPELDSDLGPSNPLPKEPALYGSEEDSVLVYKCNDSKRLVTALAITEDPDGKSVLYSGHDDGMLIKWSLESNTQIWSKQVYVNGQEDFGNDFRGSDLFHVKETPGVSHIAIRADPVDSKQHIVYTWSDAYTGYPENDYDDRLASVITARSGMDGRVLRNYSYDIGEDVDGNSAHPSISTVVFCSIYLKNRWWDTMIVGLYCQCGVLDYDESYDDYDLDEAREFSEGNIVPFLEHNGRALKSWRGHSGLVRAMAVIEDHSLLSISIQPGTGRPDEMILWSLDNPGIPLCRFDCWNPKKSRLNQMVTRLDEFCGICSDGKEVLIADYFADRIAVLKLEDEDGDPCIKIEGYGGIGIRHYDDGGYHGRMASSSNGSHAAMANDISQTVWIFKTKGCADHDKLDWNDGNPRKYDKHLYSYDDDDEDAKMRRRAGREIAVGMVKFPLWGGSDERPKKKAKFEWPIDMESVLRRDDKNDCSGEGGPIMLALRGRWLVAGFSNGSIARMLLPDSFEENRHSLSSNHLSCVSYLPSDEWHTPVLEHEED